MKDHPAKYAQLGLEVWEKWNLPFIEKGKYRAARDSLGHTIYLIELGLKGIPKSKVRMHTEQIQERLIVLKKYLTETEEIEIQEDSEREASYLKTILNEISDMSIIAGFGINAILKAEAGQNGEQYKQGL